MKRYYKILISTMALALSSSSILAADFAGSFQWVGTVPTDNVESTWRMINSGTVDHLAGTVSFSGSTGAYEVTDSSELTFSVVTKANETVPAKSFDYTLTSLRFSTVGGFMKDANTTTNFIMTANGATLDIDTPITGEKGEVAIKVKTAAATDVIKAGDEVVIQAIILVNNQI
jgi:hypothetical protein